MLPFQALSWDLSPPFMGLFWGALGIDTLFRKDPSGTQRKAEFNQETFQVP